MTPTRDQIRAKMQMLDLEKKRLRVLSRLVILENQIKEISVQAHGADGSRRARSGRSARHRGSATCQANMAERAGAG